VRLWVRIQVWENPEAHDKLHPFFLKGLQHNDIDG